MVIWFFIFLTHIYSDLVVSPTWGFTPTSFFFAQDEHVLQRQLADLKRRRELELRIGAMISSGSIPVSELERSYVGLLKALDELEGQHIPVSFS